MDEDVVGHKIFAQDEVEIDQCNKTIGIAAGSGLRVDAERLSRALIKIRPSVRVHDLRSEFKVSFLRMSHLPHIARSECLSNHQADSVFCRLGKHSKRSLGASTSGCLPMARLNSVSCFWENIQKIPAVEYIRLSTG